MKFTVFCLAILILTLSLSAYAQEGKLSRVRGEVTDIYGAGISDVVIKAKDANGKIYPAKFLNGRDYEIALPQGVYTILVVRSPFKTVELKGYQTGYDIIQRLDFCLVCGEGCEETILVGKPEEKETLQERDDRGSVPKKPSAK